VFYPLTTPALSPLWGLAYEDMDTVEAEATEEEARPALRQPATPAKTRQEKQREMEQEQEQESLPVETEVCTPPSKHLRRLVAKWPPIGRLITVRCTLPAYTSLLVTYRTNNPLAAARLFREPPRNLADEAFFELFTQFVRGFEVKPEAVEGQEGQSVPPSARAFFEALDCSDWPTFQGIAIADSALLWWLRFAGYVAAQNAVVQLQRRQLYNSFMSKPSTESSGETSFPAPRKYVLSKFRESMGWHSEHTWLAQAHDEVIWAWIVSQGEAAKESLVWGKDEALWL
jgi:hypothetical protein